MNEAHAPQVESSGRRYRLEEEVEAVLVEAPVRAVRLRIEALEPRITPNFAWGE